MVGFYPSILVGWGKDKGVPCACAPPPVARSGRAMAVGAGRQAGRRRAGGRGLVLLLTSHNCGSFNSFALWWSGLASISGVTVSWSPRLASSPPRCGNKSPLSYSSSSERDNRSTDTTTPLLGSDLCPVTSCARGCGRASASKTIARLRTLPEVCRRLGFWGATTRLLLYTSSVDVFFLEARTALQSSPCTDCDPLLQATHWFYHE
jgi:hypothetical protein